MGRDYGSIVLAFMEMNKRKDAVESIENGLDTLLELEEQTGYHHLLIATLKQIKELLDNLGS